MPVGKHPALRDHFHLQLDLGPAAPPRQRIAPLDLPRPQRTPPRQAPKKKSGMSTLWLILAVLAAFGVAGYFLMNRGA